MPHTPPIGRKKSERVIAGWLVVIGIVIAVVAGTGYQYDKAKQKAEVEKAKAAAYAAAHPPAQRIIVRAQRPWTSQTFDVPAGGLRLWLESGSARYPKLGGVLTHTSSGRSYVDQPGVDHDGMNNPAGWFTFLPDPPGSKRKIEIYNRW